MTKADGITNAEFWGLSKYIEKDSLDIEESKEWYEALELAYTAFTSQKSSNHQSVLDFAEWFMASPETNGA